MAIRGSRDVLVSTGDTDADAYLDAYRRALRAQQVEHEARDAWLRAEAAELNRDGFHGTAERRQRAARHLDEARRATPCADADATRAGAPVRRDNPHLADLVHAEIAEAGIARYGPE